jgi:hypothetical protein
MINISYRDKFIKSVKEKYSTETEAYRRKEKAVNLIYEYFGDLLDDLYDETEAADEKLEIEYDKLKLNGIEQWLSLSGNLTPAMVTIQKSAMNGLMMEMLQT